MNKIYFVKNLEGKIVDVDNLNEAEKRFSEYLNSTEIIEKDSSGREKIIKKRTHKKVGEIEINNKCVYVKVPFYQPSDLPKIKVSKIGEFPEKLRSKMEIVDENWYE